jgi:dihydroorotate dehydrogenase
VRVGDVSSNPLVRTLALAVVRRLVLRLSAPLGRLVPIVGGGISGWTNYVEIGRAGHRMMAYYRARRSMIDDESAEIIEVDVVR